MPRLVRLEVKRLLWQFDHTIDFPTEWAFVILHGPNGIGKTRILELIDATFGFRWWRLVKSPFASARFSFDDGSNLIISRGEQAALPGLGSDEDLRVPLSIVLKSPGEDDVSWSGVGVPNEPPPPRALRAIELELPVQRVERNAWRDMRTGEIMQYPDLIDKYPDFFMKFDIADSWTTQREIKERLRTFIDSVNVHLIETQRLLTIEAEPFLSPRERKAQRPTVLEFALDLSRRLAEALATNSRTSQQLDRTFPRRVLLGNPLPATITDEQIRARYNEQSDLRSRLAEIAVLDTTTDLPLPETSLADWQRRVLWTYLDDTDKKLATFQSLLEKVNLLRDIVNSRFLFEELKIDLDKGFRFVLKKTGQEIRPMSLSSGEQHELVLAYDLLFNVKPDALVLIDEPEISLHVAWQQQFLNDIARIAEVASLRFIIATHSPQIIHKWWAQAVALGPDAEDGRPTQ